MRTPRRSFPLMAAVSVLLFACNQAPSSVQEEGLPPGSPYANGAQHPWSDRLDTQITDPYAAGRDYPWASPQAGSSLPAQGLYAGVNFLSELQWTSATSGWGPIERNRSNGQMGARDGGPLVIGGQTFARGLGVHADSDVRYALNGQCSSFNAVIGIDDEVGALGRATFQVIGDGRVLYDSGELTGKDSGRQVDVMIAGVRELQLKVLKGANTYYDHADWADARVTCTSLLPTGNVVLSELPYASATNGWGPVEIDRSNGEQTQFDGKPLTIGGQVFAKGLGVHASSKFVAGLNYDLGRACTTFTASIGIDDEVGDRGSVIFKVYGDGQKLYDSGVVRGRDAARRITVDVNNVKALKLAVTDAGDTMNFDHADWANPQVSCVASPSGTVDPSFGTQGTVTTTGLGTPVAVLGNGTIVLARHLTDRTEFRRLLPSGARDTRFGSSGVLALPASTLDTIYPDGRIVLVTESNATSELTVARFLADGRPDLGFGVAGRVVVPGQLGVQKVKVGQGGDLYLGGLHGLVRLSVAGVPDPAFRTNSAPAFDLGDHGYPDINSSSTDYADFDVRPDGGAAVLVTWTGEQQRGESTYPLGSMDLTLLDAQGRPVGGSSESYFGGVTGLQVATLERGQVFGTGIAYSGLRGYLSAPSLNGMESNLGACGDSYGVAAGPANTLLTFAGLSGSSAAHPICRFTAAGVLDTTFGTDGGSVGEYRAINVLTQPDAGLLVVEADRLTRLYP